MQILFEDKYFIICNKPPGMPVQEDKSMDDNVHSTLVDHMKTKGFLDPYIGMIHRLDRPVGGIMVFSKQPKTTVFLNQQLQNKEIEKHYYALVEGIPKEKAYSHYLKKKFKDNTSKVVDPSTPKAKKADLTFKVIEQVTIEEVVYSLVDIHLLTGRHHQIRVQFAHEGHALWGDTKYNPKFQNQKGWFDIALFAYQLTFTHPKFRTPVGYEVKPTVYPFTLTNL